MKIELGKNHKHKHKHKHKYHYGLFYCKGCSLCPGHNGEVCKCGKVKRQ